jgi:Xaa-Pro aminopeptidase
MIKEIMKEKQVDAVLVSERYNMNAISRFSNDTGVLYISDSRKVLLTDSRYSTQAREESVGFEVVEVAGEKNYDWYLAEFVKADQVKRLGFEEDVLTVASFRKKQEAVPGIEWVPMEGSLATLREVKTEEELRYLEKAEAIGDAAFSYILGELKVGVTELEIAAKLEYFMKMNGASGVSFDPIVASGFHSAMPHAVPSEKKLEKGDFVTMDFGCIYKGYCSDMTRTVVMGKASDKQKEIYQIVLEAQQAGLEAIREGVTGGFVDKAARDVIAGAGYGEYFGHSLGHSVGLFIHETPGMFPNSTAVLKANMIETVEPGIYIPEFGGVRIEDMVVVRKDGYKNLTHSDKQLLEL